MARNNKGNMESGRELKLLIATSETSETGHRILVDGIDLGKNPNVMMYENADSRKPIGRALVTIENGSLWATLDSPLPDRLLDLTPSVSLRMSPHDTNEMGNGRIDIIRCQLFAIFLTGAPNKDPRVRSIREQMKDAEV